MGTFLSNGFPDHRSNTYPIPEIRFIITDSTKPIIIINETISTSSIAWTFCRIKASTKQILQIKATLENNLKTPIVFCQKSTFMRKMPLFCPE
jgi:hypothetical protein